MQCFSITLSIEEPASADIIQITFLSTQHHNQGSLEVIIALALT